MVLFSYLEIENSQIKTNFKMILLFNMFICHKLVYVLQQKSVNISAVISYTVKARYFNL